MKVSFEVVRKLRVIADDALVLSDECLTHVRSCSALGDLPVTVFGLTNASVDRVRNAKDRPTRILRSCANSSASTLNEPSCRPRPEGACLCGTRSSLGFAGPLAAGLPINAWC